MLYRTETDGIVGGVGGDSVCCTELRQTALLVLEVIQCVVQD